jgi:hypothetical protein
MPAASDAMIESPILVVSVAMTGGGIRDSIVLQAAPSKLVSIHRQIYLYEDRIYHIREIVG